MEAVTHYGELFVAGGEPSKLEEAVVKAGDLDADAGGLLVLRLSTRGGVGAGERSPLLKGVSAAGYTIEIDESGRPHVVLLVPAVTDLNTELIKERAKAAGCEDKRMLWSLDYGARAEADATPRNTVYHPNHPSAWANKEAATALWESEMAEGWTGVTKHPSTFTLCMRPMMPVPKLKVVDGTTQVTV